MGKEKSNGFNYSPYGYSHFGLSSIPLVRYVGERQDSKWDGYVLGNGYRVYSPCRMRFNSPDGWSPFDEGGFNAYAYCNNDPINYCDPTGHELKPIYAKAAAEWASRARNRVKIHSKIIENQARTRLRNGLRGGTDANLPEHVKSKIIKRSEDIHADYVRQLSKVGSRSMVDFVKLNPGSEYSMVLNSRLTALQAIQNGQITPGNLGMIVGDAGWAAAAIGLHNIEVKTRVESTFIALVAALRGGDFDFGMLSLDDAYTRLYNNKPPPKGLERRKRLR
jgi:RHS repeat-associated protein